MLVVAIHLVALLLGAGCALLGWFVGLVALAFLWPALWVSATVRADHGKHWGPLAFVGTMAASLLMFRFMQPWPAVMSWVWLLWPPGYCWRQARARRRRTTVTGDPAQLTANDATSGDHTNHLESAADRAIAADVHPSRRRRPIPKTEVHRW